MANAPVPAPGTAPDNAGYPQWGIKQSGSTWTVIEATSATAKQQDIDNGYLDWFTSKKAAQEQVSSQSSVLNGKVPGLSWVLSGSGLAGWFLRGVKMLFGGILMISAISHLTGLDNKAAQLVGTAGKAALL